MVEGFNGELRYMLYTIAAATGYRKKELSELTPASFHLAGECPEIVVPGSLTKNGKPAQQPLPDYLIPTLVNWLANKPAGEILFPKLGRKKTGLMMKHDLIDSGLDYRIKGTNEFRDFHQWRHLYITNAWSSGESPLVVKELARHSKMATTMGYSHTESRQLHDAINRADQLPLPDQETTEPEKPSV